MFFRKRKRKVRKNRACPFRQIQIPTVDLVNSLLKRILVLTEYETGQTTKGYIPLHKFNRNSLLSLFIHSAPTPLFESQNSSWYHRIIRQTVNNTSFLERPSHFWRERLPKLQIQLGISRSCVSVAKSGKSRIKNPFLDLLKGKHPFWASEVLGVTVDVTRFITARSPKVWPLLIFSHSLVQI